MKPTCSGPVPGTPVSTLGEFDLRRLGYVAQEWFLAGTAHSWRSAGELGDDGRWAVEVAASAPFKTRLLVCRPADPPRFKGTVVVEWLNVSGGGDGSPDWFFLHRHLIREGAAWVGVSAQKAGIDGGGLFDSGQHLKNVAPERYEALMHPGDAFSFDIFSQAGIALRTGTGPLAGLDVETMLAIGESQSATFLVTYVNAIDPQAGIYDGFVIHGRGASGASLEGEMRARRVSGDTLDLTSQRDAWSPSHRIREDVRVPVITVQSETDVMMFAGVRARQPDNDRFRLWEIAGAAHFDTYGLVAAHQDDGSLPVHELAALVAPTDEVLGQKAASLVNSGPQQHYVLNAAIAHLGGWVRQGSSPPSAARLETTGGDDPALALDELGIVRGGVRTPWVDAPVAVLSGLGQEGAVFTVLFGVTRPFDNAQLDRLYPNGREQYLAAFERCLDEAIASGFILEADRGEILALAAAACPFRLDSSTHGPGGSPPSRG